jgi:sialate O-acetylesterase
MFQDHAVLQRDKPIRIWGRAKPGRDVTVSFAGIAAKAQADGEGRWSAVLPPMPAGGPYTLKARTGWRTNQSVKDILVGDVWLCSGQSNMVLQVRRTLDSRSEIENSANDTIRMLTVRIAASPAPLESFLTPVQWLVASPSTVPDFSATCFYFARELQKTVHVPMGLVNASWGGSKIETWMSADGIRALGGYDAQLGVLNEYAADRPAGTKRWGAMWEDWWKQRTGAAGGPPPWSATLSTDGWHAAPQSLGFWDNWGEPGLVNFAGMVWYRTSLRVTSEQAAQPATLSLGAVDEVDQTWVNGTFVGGGSGGERTYELPVGTLHAGENTIAVNVLNTYKLGGLIGPPGKQVLRLKNGAAVALSGPWLYKAVPLSVGQPPRAPWEPIAGLSMAYNAMIAPIGRYGFRAAVWYQGESNTSEPESYRSLLVGLMADWRKTFGADLAFLIVQLPGYGPAPTAPQDSGWAKLREAQRQVVAGDARSALVVTIDIGERYDIHPANKQEVGRRLSRAARKIVYGEAIISTGPIATSARRDNSAIVVDFDDVEGSLATYSSNAPIGFELCGATQASCRFATARINAGEVRLAGDGMGLTRVRYCWADSPICTLFDQAGLPAGPFELPIER